MKNIIIGICSFVLLGILILTMYTLHGRSIRQQELNHALTSSMQSVMDSICQDIECAPKNNEELVALFLQEFLVQIESNSQVTVHVLDVDHEKGLLSVEAILEFMHPIGTSGTVSAHRTVIIEDELQL